MFAVIDTELLNKITEQGITFLFDYGPKLLGAAIILVIGLVAAMQVGKALQRWLGKRDLEPPVRILIVRVARLMVMGLTLMLVLEKVGVAIAPIIAGLGVAGVPACTFQCCGCLGQDHICPTQYQSIAQAFAQLGPKPLARTMGVGI